LARSAERVESEVLAEAGEYLDEMVAGYGRSQVDVALQLGRFMYRQAYEDQPDLDAEQAERVADAVRRHAAVLLPTHRSNFDSGVMPTVWHQLGLPPTHTFAGINMAFWPLGPVMRRSGSIFIRRDTKHAPVYRFVLREYVGYLVEKRFHLEWYIEGGRSRTGKLLPPRLGLLVYVLDAYREGRTDDVVLVPASISYDQLREVAEFADEARGVPKQKESMGWLVNFVRSNRGKRYGKIYVRFGEPLSLRQMLGPPTGGTTAAPGGRDEAIDKIGFEVSWRINAVTPITATALVTLALLGAGGRALTFGQVSMAVKVHLEDAAERNLPMTDSARNLRTDEGMRAALQALVDKQVVVVWDKGPDVVYAVGPDQHLAAAFYRNSIVHHFLDASISQLALAATDPTASDRLAAFWETATRIRDLLKFEFFFREKTEFRAALAAELAQSDPTWQDRIRERATGPVEVLERFRLLTAPITLRPFIEALSIAASELHRRGNAPVTDPGEFLAACTGLGRQRLLQMQIRSADSVSRHLFASGLQLANNLGMVEVGDDLGERRAALAAELRSLLGDLDAIEAIALAAFRRRMLVEDAS
jgi:glycerol-3-phosphate O-acyltransferase